jgi:protein disulfide-isomerase
MIRIFMFALMAAGCVSPKAEVPADSFDQLATYKEPLFAQAPWYQGDLEAGLAAAKAQKLPILLYWGAVWCPPCNELKQNVFAHPEFSEAVKGVIAIYLDGDSPRAQKWADRYEVGGYPTILVLDENEQEINRLSGTLDFLEFNEALLTSIRNSRLVKQVFLDAAQGKLSLAQWSLLNFYSWDDIDSLDFSRPELISLLQKIRANIPKAMIETRATVTARYYAIIAADLEENAQFLKSVSVKKFDDEVLAHQAGIIAARSVLLFDAPEIVKMLFKETERGARLRFLEKWKNALEVIAKYPRTSLDTKVWILNAKLRLDKIRYPSAGRSKNLRYSIRKELAKIERKAKTEFQRRSIIPSIAYVLIELGESSKARKLLLREIKVSKTPWYLQSSLSRLEEKLGNKQAALKWSAEARKSARGRASRIQWAASDLLINLRFSDETKIENVGAVIHEFYTLVFSIGDGFSGRNLTRLSAVKKQLNQYPQLSALKPVLQKYRQKCDALDSDSTKRCIKHFDRL